LKPKEPPSAADQALDGAKVRPQLLNQTERLVSGKALSNAIKRAIERKKRGRLLWVARQRQKANATKATGSGSGSGSAKKLAFPEPSPAEGSGTKPIPFPRRYPSQCRLYNYKREYLPVLGCTCDEKCRVQYSNKTKIQYAACDAQPGTSCFGQRQVMCHHVAKTLPLRAKSCHISCRTCSPGQDANSLASPDACRSCSASKAWIPKAGSRGWPECVIGQQQGSCAPYPLPSQTCRTGCSPSTLTTKYRPRVQVTSVSKGGKQKVTDQDSVPVMACAKACTDGYKVQLEGNNAAKSVGPIARLEATVFCATYKLVSCKITQKSMDLGSANSMGKGKGKKPKKPAANLYVSKRENWQTEWGPAPAKGAHKYLCNQRKHSVFVGFQAHGNEDAPYQVNLPFYVSNNSAAQAIFNDWRTTFKGTARNAAPANVLEAKLFSVVGKSDELCLKHTLLH